MGHQRLARDISGGGDGFVEPQKVRTSRTTIIAGEVLAERGLDGSFGWKGAEIVSALPPNLEPTYH